MANRTQKDAKSIKGTNPQYLVEKIIRTRIYDSKYWKEQCFGLSSELLVDKAMVLEAVGGVCGGNVQPSNFLCLVLKMLQIQPSKDIIIEFIKNPDYKYVRALGALYLRLVGNSMEIFNYLEPLYNDYRKLKLLNRSGEFEMTHVDEFVDNLLHNERMCDIILPRIQKRHVLEQTEQLEPRVSALDEDLEGDDEEEEEEEEEEEDSPPPHWRSPSPRYNRDRERFRSRSRSPRRRRSVSRSRSRSPYRRRRSHSRSPRRFRHRSPSPRRHARRSPSPTPHHHYDRGGGRGERERERERGRDRDRDRDREREERGRERGRDRNRDREERDREEKRSKEEDRERERDREEKKSRDEDRNRSGKTKEKKKKKSSQKQTSKEYEEIRQQNELRAKLGLKPLKL